MNILFAVIGLCSFCSSASCNADIYAELPPPFLKDTYGFNLSEYVFIIFEFGLLMSWYSILPDKSNFAILFAVDLSF